MSVFFPLFFLGLIRQYSFSTIQLNFIGQNFFFQALSGKKNSPLYNQASISSAVLLGPYQITFFIRPITRPHQAVFLFFSLPSSTYNQASAIQLGLIRQGFFFQALLGKRNFLLSRPYQAVLFFSSLIWQRFFSALQLGSLQQYFQLGFIGQHFFSFLYIIISSLLYN